MLNLLNITFQPVVIILTIFGASAIIPFLLRRTFPKKGAIADIAFLKEAYIKRCKYSMQAGFFKVTGVEPPEPAVIDYLMESSCPYSNIISFSKVRYYYKWTGKALSLNSNGKITFTLHSLLCLFLLANIVIAVLSAYNANMFENPVMYIHFLVIYLFFPGAVALYFAYSLGAINKVEQMIRKEKDLSEKIKEEKEMEESIV